MLRRRYLLFVLAIFAVNHPACAQSATEFFRGKTISILVGAGEGGSFMPYAHLLAEHLRRHVPGAHSVIAKSMGGQGGSLHTAQLMQHTVARDGLTMATLQPTIVIAQVLSPNMARYDARQWNWVGSMVATRNMLAVWHTAKAQSIAEARQHEVVVGATNQNSATYIVPSLLNRYAGTRFKLVTGYKNAGDLTLALRRGEIEARGASWLSVEMTAPELIAEEKIKPLVFASITREPKRPDVPTLIEVLDDPWHKEAARFLSAESNFGHAFFLPPDVPTDRVDVLRKAFQDAVGDPALLEDARRRRMPIEPATGEALAQLTARVLGTPPEIVEMTR